MTTDSTNCAEPQGIDDWRNWRKAERKRLIDLRMSHTPEERAAWGEHIAHTLYNEIMTAGARMVSAYWPMKGEPDLRPLLKRLASEGVGTALPVVVEKNHPMEFRRWKSGDKLSRGIWHIPIPAEGRAVTPDLVISPVVGFDPNAYRLGYGGGYFDRTLASLPDMPLVLGIGYSSALIRTIHPQPFDIPMSKIITEDGIVA